ncbi:MAG: hypothetical protein KGL25_00005, partial [Gammaproteobacteria bacterium]|nr:hypothetical protein [Gammaproteobacteria bacterium]
MIAASIVAGSTAGAAPAVAAGAPGAAAATAVNHVNVPVPANERVTLPNGLRLVLVPRHDIPLVAFNLLL